MGWRISCCFSRYIASNSLWPNGEAPQAPLSMGFSRQEYWSGLPFPSPGDHSVPGNEPMGPALQVDSSLNHQGSPSWRKQVLYFSSPQHVNPVGNQTARGWVRFLGSSAKWRSEENGIRETKRPPAQTLQDRHFRFRWLTGVETEAPAYQLTHLKSESETGSDYRAPALNLQIKMAKWSHMTEFIPSLRDEMYGWSSFVQLLQN